MSDPWVERARQLLSQRLGFTQACVRADKVAQVLASLRAQGTAEPEALEQLARGETQVARAFEDAVVVGETFLFREPAHFDLVLSEALPAFFASGRSTFRAWSAGCASGEEAWSLAAVLLPPLQARERQLSVLGTDVSSRQVELARAGLYGKWSQRPSTPCPVAVFEPGAGEPRAVRSALREVTRFAVQNLLTPAPELHDFDVIFCRNVLVYFEPAVAARVAADLVTRLARGGLVAFGPMDLRAQPGAAQRVGPVELNAWRQPPVTSSRVGAPVASRPLPEALLPAALDGSVIPLHLRALSLLEEDRWREALALLEQASGLCPDYLPALLERALIHERRGDRRAAATLMRSLLSRAEQVEGPVSGPEPLPAEYFRSTAQIYLARVESAP